MFNLYADVDARSMTPSRNTRSYTLRSVPSSPGRSFLFLLTTMQTQLEERMFTVAHKMNPNIAKLLWATINKYISVFTDP